MEIVKNNANLVELQEQAVKLQNVVNEKQIVLNTATKVIKADGFNETKKADKTKSNRAVKTATESLDLAKSELKVITLQIDAIEHQEKLDGIFALMLETSKPAG